MKNKIIMLLSAALVLTSISAFAKEITSQKTNIMNKTSVNEAVKNSLQKAYEENKAKESNPEDEIKEICKNDKYCIEYAAILPMLGFKSDELIYELRDIKDYKQELYNLKYSLSTNSELYYGFLFFDSLRIYAMTEFDQMKESIIDMPMTPVFFVGILKKMKSATKSEKDKKFLDSLLKKYTGKLFPQNFEEIDITAFSDFIKSNAPFCPKDLNVNDYGFDSLCFLPYPLVINNPQGESIEIKQGSGKNVFKNMGNQELKKVLKKQPEENEEMIFAYFESDR